MTGYVQNKQQHSAPDKHHHSHDTLSRVVWASMLIYAGLIFLADNLDLLPAVSGADSWDWIKLGAGGLLLLEGCVRAVAIDHPEPNLWRLILGMALLGWGASAIFNIQISSAWWPVILIILGLSTFLRGLHR